MKKITDLTPEERPSDAGPADADAALADAEPGLADAEPAPAGAETETGSADAETGSASRPRRHRMLISVLAVATVLSGAFGIWASVAGHDLRAASAGANGAITDRAATRAVEQDVTRAVNTIFSYSYADTGRTKTAAQRWLTGQAIKQYDQLFALVEQQAPAQQLTVATKVTQIGVEFLSGGRARVLVFANQQDTRAGTTQASYAGAMFAVTAVHRGSTWKIENIDTFTR